MRPWPHPDALMKRLEWPRGVRCRYWTDDELERLPATLLAWYPTVRVGAESIWLKPGYAASVAVSDLQPDRDVYVLCFEKNGEAVAFLSFVREPTAGTLHARLGVLAPEERRGTLGYFAFLIFESLGGALEAELLSVWVTLASKGQQLFARRRGFRLCGIVPGFDRDAVGEGSMRVAEALYTKLLVDEAQVQDPRTDALLEETAEMWQQVRGETRPTSERHSD